MQRDAGWALKEQEYIDFRKTIPYENKNIH